MKDEKTLRIKRIEDINFKDLKHHALDIKDLKVKLKKKKDFYNNPYLNIKFKIDEHIRFVTKIDGTVLITKNKEFIKEFLEKQNSIKLPFYYFKERSYTFKNVKYDDFYLDPNNEFYKGSPVYEELEKVFKNQDSTIWVSRQMHILRYKVKFVEKRGK